MPRVPVHSSYVLLLPRTGFLCGRSVGTCSTASVDTVVRIARTEITKSAGTGWLLVRSMQLSVS